MCQILLGSPERFVAALLIIIAALVFGGLSNDKDWKHMVCAVLVVGATLFLAHSVAEVGIKLCRYF